MVFISGLGLVHWILVNTVSFSTCLVLCLVVEYRSAEKARRFPTRWNAAEMA